MIHQFDTVIVGSGGAGLYAALEASGRSRTAVLSKLYPRHSVSSQTVAILVSSCAFRSWIDPRGYGIVKTILNAPNAARVRS